MMDTGCSGAVYVDIPGGISVNIKALQKLHMVGGLRMQTNNRKGTKS